jgi:hypothetical protein
MVNSEHRESVLGLGVGARCCGSCRFMANPTPRPPPEKLWHTKYSICGLQILIMIDHCRRWGEINILWRKVRFLRGWRIVGAILTTAGPDCRP